jgi:hypothetical protein
MGEEEGGREIRDLRNEGLEEGEVEGAGRLTIATR